MPLSFERNEISNPEVKQAVESVIRDFVGDRQNEDWNARIHSFSNYYHVVLKGPAQTRQQIFFEEPRALAEKIRDWLELYPLR